VRAIADVAVALVAILHVYFLVLETFLWTRPFGLKAFGLTPEFAKASQALAASQGLYNGFIAAGLGWGLVAGNAGYSIKMFFLGCVIVAGVFGGFTASRKIFWVQALPGSVALALVLLAR
jgi:putative membrane protein